ncbi:MAG: PHP domain-containing protein [Oscillospiraceae bacterium]|nr:PHP domain-containing protein [Oscillospiraceae bacterium]
MKNHVDLHMHSTYSDDGEFTPTELVHQCKTAGVRTMSITDHDSARGNAEARAEAEKLGINYISGIEIDCRFNGINLHLLGYGFNDSSSDFITLEEHILSGERNASRERLELTRKLGFCISETELNAISNIDDGTGIWTGEVFAELLLEKQEYLDNEHLLPYRTDGSRADNPFVNFYWDYYAQGKPCYVEVDFPTLKDAVALVRDNGGKAVLAHPGNNLKGRLELFDEIVKAGIDGVEVFCSYHDEKTAQYFYEQAQKHSLLITCGSDYHGKTKPSVKLGETGCWIDSQQIESQFCPSACPCS